MLFLSCISGGAGGNRLPLQRNEFNCTAWAFFHADSASLAVVLIDNVSAGDFHNRVVRADCVAVIAFEAGTAAHTSQSFSHEIPGNLAVYELGWR